MAHWKQIRWNLYRLRAPGHNKDFVDYDKLYHYCKRHGLNPTQD